VNYQITLSIIYVDVIRGGLMNDVNPQQPTPGTPNEGQSVQPAKPDTEINPARPGNNTEVDLDKSKTKTYPDKTPPERH
jgi:hypothetical protein